jgi:hypothetical protein
VAHGYAHMTLEEYAKSAEALPDETKIAVPAHIVNSSTIARRRNILHGRSWSCSKPNTMHRSLNAAMPLATPTIA